MSGEIKTNDMQEVKNPALDNFKEIKSQTNISYSDAKDYWNHQLYNFDGQQPEDNSIEIIGKENQEYKDDNGNVYRVGNELVPNNEYVINGYKYETDDKGRITSASGKLHMKEREGKLPIKDSKHDIGKGDEKETDDRGHLIGDQFDGSNGLENMVPQDSKINQNDFRSFENQLADKVKSGSDVVVKIEPVYDSNSHRPDAIAVSYSIDGKQGTRVFPNP